MRTGIIISVMSCLVLAFSANAKVQDNMIPKMSFEDLKATVKGMNTHELNTATRNRNFEYVNFINLNTYYMDSLETRLDKCNSDYSSKLNELEDSINTLNDIINRTKDLELLMSDGIELLEMDDSTFNALNVPECIKDHYLIIAQLRDYLKRCNDCFGIIDITATYTEKVGDEMRGNQKYLEQMDIVLNTWNEYRGKRDGGLKISEDVKEYMKKMIYSKYKSYQEKYG